jgi:thiol-disulfide isomerase/thioredoxin
VTRPAELTTFLDMDAVTVAIALAGLVLAATLLGVLHRVSQGRARTVAGSPVVRLDGVVLGDRATLLQFSSEVCTPCRATARVLDDLAARVEAVAHVELDVARRPELASRFHVLQTPTTLILDADGAVRSRMGGAVRRDVVLAELERVLAA